MGTFDAAAQQANQQRSALLSAIAQAGTAGRQAYEAAQADLATQRKNAISAAQAAAGARGAPEALQPELANTIATPYDRLSASLTAGAASRAADLAQRQANTESYLSETAAAVPLVRAHAEQRLAEMRTKAAGGASRASGGGATEKELSDPQLKIRLLGAADYAKEQVPKVKAAIGVPAGPEAVAAAVPRYQAADAAERATREELARQIGVDSGYDAARVYGLIQPPKPGKPPKPEPDPSASKAGLSPTHAADLRRNTRYGEAKADIEERFASGTPVTKDELLGFLGSAPRLKGRDDIKRLLLAEYAPLTSSSGATIVVPGK